MSMTICSIQGCLKAVAKRRQICAMHAQRMLRRGSYDLPTLAQRLWSRVEKTDTCWLWTGHTNNGYGRIQDDGVAIQVHRAAWTLIRGDIPEGMQLDHICRVRNCCNPDHLEPVQPRVNYMRGIGPTAINARKTHCKWGHPFTGDNLRVLPDGRRECRACRFRRQEERKERRTA